MKLLKAISFISFCIAISVLLTLTIKGNEGNPLPFQNDHNTKVGGPFEASNTTSRYALTLAIAENGSFFLNEDLAKFASPDVVKYKDMYMSIFAPGVSFIVIPFYLFGKKLGLPQVVTFLSVTFFALFNLFLIAWISIKLGSGFWTGFLGGFIFLFGTNALSYAQTLSQHHFTVTVALLAIITAMGKRTLIKNIWFGILFGLGVLVDIPNVFLLAPILIYILYRQFYREISAEIIRVNMSLNFIGLILGVLPFIALFAWYNRATTGSYTMLAQSIGRMEEHGETFSQSDSVILREQKDVRAPKGIRLPFNPRKQLAGAYTLFISDERSWIYYSPVVLLGIFGLFKLLKNQKYREFAAVSLSVIFLNGIMYSMFGDPWGGWAFGPRYLIPAGALLSIGLSIIYTNWNRNILFMLIFVILAIYSLRINTLGVTTTTMIPPKIEAINLPKPIPYTYDYNFQLLNKNISSSLIYNRFLSKKLTATDYSYRLFISVSSVFLLLTIASYFEIKTLIKKSHYRKIYINNI
ncbi:MAG: hypothetical protein UV73_C0003G0057 [Candidatus Gottesmanbacteria bacterium GW2011_GWA2_43_14]|uniref:Glycosyltransferase RgtA/B/C/D-like domain-containing protein n=1 Tax=Candidatus Gottesmanbacteria bacterium GW2011_GWA2_43_14 TaxID=1618443 RepID=A0A0G1DJV8_9BACT|nr:MAG: hypothetical protein UV73_C0003G0057 [Candidatus Gottesmanbacteria bacterium GW2011_GWA2_43_14]